MPCMHETDNLGLRGLHPIIQTPCSPGMLINVKLLHNLLHVLLKLIHVLFKFLHSHVKRERGATDSARHSQHCDPRTRQTIGAGWWWGWWGCAQWLSGGCCLDSCTAAKRCWACVEPRVDGILHRLPSDKTVHQHYEHEQQWPIQCASCLHGSTASACPTGVIMPQRARFLPHPTFQNRT